MLMNVTSARIDLKFAAGARRAPASSATRSRWRPSTAAAWPARLLELAWRRVVDNSAHDSICGCSHDEVVAQVLSRYAEAEQIGHGLVAAVLRGSHRDCAAGRLGRRQPVAVRPDDVVELDLAVPADWPAVAVRVGGESSRPRSSVARAAPPSGSSGSAAPTSRRSSTAGVTGASCWAASSTASEIDADVDPATIVAPARPRRRPPEFDVDELISAIELRRPGTSGRPVGRRRSTSPSAGASWHAVPAPALGYAWATEIEASEVDVASIPNAVVGTDRSLRNGLVELAIADDGTFRLAGGGVTPGRRRADRRRRRLRRQLQLRAPGGGPHRRDPESRRRAGRATRARSAETRRSSGRFDWPRGLTVDATARTPETVLTVGDDHRRASRRRAVRPRLRNVRQPTR